jgi:hypothetical protein
MHWKRQSGLEAKNPLQFSGRWDLFFLHYTTFAVLSSFEERRAFVYPNCNFCFF